MIIYILYSSRYGNSTIESGYGTEGTRQAPVSIGVEHGHIRLRARRSRRGLFNRKKSFLADNLTVLVHDRIALLCFAHHNRHRTVLKNRSFLKKSITANNTLFVFIKSLRLVSCRLL